MNLVNCGACNQQVSPYAKACPSCGHPAAEPASAWYKLQMGVPPVFFGLVMIAAICLAAFSGFSCFSVFANAQSAIHEQLAVQFGIFSAICGLIAVVSAFGLENRH